MKKDFLLDGTMYLDKPVILGMAWILQKQDHPQHDDEDYYLMTSNGEYYITADNELYRLRR